MVVTHMAYFTISTVQTFEFSFFLFNSYKFFDSHSFDGSYFFFGQKEDKPYIHCVLLKIKIWENLI